MLVRMINTDDSTVYVNPDHVVAVTCAGSYRVAGKSILLLDTGDARGQNEVVIDMPADMAVMALRGGGV